jgi:hypothetical protein
LSDSLQLGCRDQSRNQGLQRRPAAPAAATSHGGAGGNRERRFRGQVKGLQTLALVGRRPGLRRKEIAAAPDVRVARAGKIVNWLLAQDRLVQDGGGRLYVSPKAEHLGGGDGGDSR